MLDEIPDDSREPADVTGGFLRCLCDPQLDPLFRRPALLDPRSAWCGHIPFAYWLVRATAPRVIVELGTHTGVSYMTFCHAVERERLGTRCFAVDTWQGDEHAGFYDDGVFEKLSGLHNPRFGTFSSLLRCSFDEALPFIEDGSVDLLHIDGLHTYDAVHHDFGGWQGKLSDRAVVLLHDTSERHSDFGVWRLWSELRGRYPSFEFLHGHGLGVLAVGQLVPPGLVGLLACRDPAVLATTRARFAMLGDRWDVEQLGLYRTEQVAKEAAAKLAARDQTIGGLTEHATALWQLVQSLTSQLGELARQRDSALADANAALQAAGLTLEAALQAAGRTQAELEAALREAQQAHQSELSRRVALETSTAWRITWPLRQFLARAPRLHHTARRTLHFALWTGTGRMAGRLDRGPPAVGQAAAPAVSIRSLVQAHGAAWAPLPVFIDRRAAPTLTILTDSVDADHLLGGVATALVVGAIAARHINARLRLVTRHSAPDPAALGNILYQSPLIRTHAPSHASRLT